MDTLRGKFGTSGWDDDIDADDFGEDEQDDGMEVQSPPSPVGQDERRMQVRAYNFWASLLEDRSLPCIEDLEPETLDDFGPFSVLLDFTSGIENPAVPYLGAKLAGECDAGDGIETLDDVPSRSLLSRITDHYMQILANKAPIGFEAEFVNQRGATVLYRGILLPFSSDDDTIDFIYGVINWKEVADQITTDALLLEIDNALEGADAEDRDHSDDPIGDWADGPSGENGQAGGGLADDDGFDDLPLPSFGDASATFDAEADVRAEAEAMAARLLSSEEGEETGEDESGEYNADDWSTPLSSLIKPKGERQAREPILPAPSDMEALEEDGEDDFSAAYEPAAIPRAYEAHDDAPVSDDADDAGDAFAEDDSDNEDASSEHAFSDQPAEEEAPLELEAPFEAEAPLDLDAFVAIEDDAVLEGDYASLETTDAPATEIAFTPSAGADENAGLYDCLAEARELAQAAHTSEDRSRNALYAAVGRAYDVSLAAEEAPEDFEELVTESGLTVQDRAPMTPVVKLVFGADYDKTRLTEYAAVLSHAHRMELERGSLSSYLASAEGGLKGVVQAERRLRREESGKPVAAEGEVREALAKKLRNLEHSALDTISADGAEFGVVMIRRLPSGEVVLVGEIEDDVKLVEQVGRKLVA